MARVVASRRLLLVFTPARPGEGHWYLARGFQHCFAVIQRARGWRVLDPTARGLVMHTLPDIDAADLAAANLGLGRHVLAGRQTRSTMRAQNRYDTCVEAMKRLLGITSTLPLTPRQLHDHAVRSLAFRECLASADRSAHR